MIPTRGILGLSTGTSKPGQAKRYQAVTARWEASDAQGDDHRRHSTGADPTVPR